MKLQIAFALLAVFGAAQAAKSMYEKEGDFVGKTGDEGDIVGSTPVAIVRDTEQEENLNLVSELREKEIARENEAKAKEEEVRADDLENAYAEADKKMNQMKYSTTEILLKGENRRYLAEDARIRAKYLSLLSNFSSIQAEALSRLAKLEL